MKRNPTPRPTYNAAPVALPGDVRLMNVTSLVLFALVGLAVAAAAVLWAARHPLFSIRSIRIEGDVTRNSVATIRANAAPKLKGNFFTTKLATDKAAFEAVPWVRKAEVRREWPGKLVVRLEEHRAVALWGSDAADDKLVNSYGEVFQANLGDVEDDKLPSLNGPLGSAALMLQLLQSLQPLFAKLDTHIDTLRLTGRGSWHAELDSGAEVALGRGTRDELVASTERFVGTVLPMLAQYQRPLEYADLRHHDGYALKLRGVTTGVVVGTANAAAKAKKN
ncbi:MAG: FtsQ-type POTRA domain-containing protein [Pseudorhodobacter sp.]|nr:FtsQ-type POTRA domain-containing protein [Rhizobacter sp.]